MISISETVTGGVSKAANASSLSNGFNMSSLLDSFSSADVGKKIAKTINGVIKTKTKKDLF